MNHQKQSGAMVAGLASRIAESIRSHQKPSEAIRNHQKQLWQTLSVSRIAESIDGAAPPETSVPSATWTSSASSRRTLSMPEGAPRQGRVTAAVEGGGSRGAYPSAACNWRAGSARPSPLVRQRGLRGHRSVGSLGEPQGTAGCKGRACPPGRCGGRDPLAHRVPPA